MADRREVVQEVSQLVDKLQRSGENNLIDLSVDDHLAAGLNLEGEITNGTAMTSICRDAYATSPRIE